MSNDDRAHYTQLIGQLKRRLRVLQLQAARSGYSVDPSVTLEIEDIERELDGYQQQLNALEQQEQPSVGFAQADPAARSLRPPWLDDSAPLGPIRNRWALLVGVNNYVDSAIPRLGCCAADAKAMKLALESLNYTVVAMHDELDRDDERFPTKANVEAELAKLCQVAQPEDLLLLFFACHGQRVANRPMLLLRDTRLQTIARTGLALDEIEAQIHTSARRRVMLLDACHAGVDGQRGLPDPEFVRNVYEQARGFALIAASTAQQQAHEQPELGHGVFTHFVLDGLAGAADRDSKGFVTVHDLSAHVLDALRRWSVTHGGALQEPTARAETIGDIILADHRGRSGTPVVIPPNPFGKTGRITDPSS